STVRCSIGHFSPSARHLESWSWTTPVTHPPTTRSTTPGCKQPGTHHEEADPPCPLPRRRRCRLRRRPDRRERPRHLRQDAHPGADRAAAGAYRRVDQELVDQLQPVHE